MGTLGAYLAWRLQLPLVISCYASLHAYAERRTRRLLGYLGDQISSAGARLAAWTSLRILRWFYRRGQTLFAPNHEICDWLHSETGRPVYLMSRGVDTNLFTPLRRGRVGADFVSVTSVD
jgi:hypothetical protein